MKWGLGDLGGFQQVIAKSPLTPLCERGEKMVPLCERGEKMVPLCETVLYP